MTSTSTRPKVRDIWTAKETKDFIREVVRYRKENGISLAESYIKEHQSREILRKCQMKRTTRQIQDKWKNMWRHGRIERFIDDNYIEKFREEKKLHQLGIYRKKPSIDSQGQKRIPEVLESNAICQSTTQEYSFENIQADLLDLLGLVSLRTVLSESFYGVFNRNHVTSTKQFHSTLFAVLCEMDLQFKKRLAIKYPDGKSSMQLDMDRVRTWLDERSQKQTLKENKQTDSNLGARNFSEGVDRDHLGTEPIMIAEVDASLDQRKSPSGKESELSGACFANREPPDHTNKESQINSDDDLDDSGIMPSQDSSEEDDDEWIQCPSRKQVEPSSWLCKDKRTLPTGYSAYVTGRTLTWNEWYCVMDWARRNNKSLAQMQIGDWNEMQSKIKLQTTKTVNQIRKDFFSHLLPHCNKIEDPTSASLRLSKYNYQSRLAIYHSLKELSVSALKKSIQNLINMGVLSTRELKASDWLEKFFTDMLEQDAAAFNTSKSDFSFTFQNLLQDSLKTWLGTLNI